MVRRDGLMDEQGDRRSRADPPTWAPVPDPTTLTLQLVDREIDHVKELVDLQFVLIERQRVESKGDTKEALAAALTAQEKAAQVLATFTADQLKALSVAFTTEIGQVRKDIAELKEGAKAGGGRTEGLTAAFGYLVGAAGIAGAIVALIAR